MSESVSILEGDKKRNVSPVDRLVVNQTGGGETYWFPAGDTQGGSITVTKNGFYYAVNNDLDFFNEVIVNVPAEMSDEDKAKGKVIVGKDPDDNGNEYAVGTEEVDDGQGGTKTVLTKTAIPSAIHIVVQPRKHEYQEGESLDYTGIHVYLMNANNQRFTNEDYPTGEIPYEELIFPQSTAEISEESYTSDEVVEPTVAQPIPASTSVPAYYVERGGNVETDKVIASTMAGGRCVDVALIPQGDSLDDTSLYGGQFVLVSVNDEPNEAVGYDEYGNLCRAYNSYTANGKTVYYYSLDHMYYNPIHCVGCEGPVTPRLDGPYRFPQERFARVAWIIRFGQKSGGGGVGVEYIPVQWMRSDGATLEDVYPITIS